MMKGRIIIGVVVLLVLAAAAWLLIAHPEVLGLKTAESQGGIYGSGIIEATEVSIAAEVGGRVLGIVADEGVEVEEGDVLLQLDTALIEAQIEGARAALDLAQANLAKIEAGARAEEVKVAEAALARAMAARDAAKSAWEDAAAARDDPQELNLRLEGARSALAVAEERLTQAQASVAAAQSRCDSLASVYDTLKKNPFIPSYILNEASKNGNLASQELWMAWSGYYQALAARDGARNSLEILLNIQENPLAAQAQVDATLAQYQASEAEVRVAQAGLDLIREGATEHQREMAEAQVEQAAAALSTLEVQLEKMSLVAPRKGIVLERTINLGEVAIPGRPLIRIANLDAVNLVVYVPEDEIGKVKVGQQAEVEVDSYPGRTFEGAVVYIAAEAEFTPQSVQTKEERVNLVFGVKIEIPNAEQLLRPGMPADAQILIQG